MHVPALSSRHFCQQWERFRGRFTLPAHGVLNEGKGMGGGGRGVGLGDYAFLGHPVTDVDCLKKYWRWTDWEWD